MNSAVEPTPDDIVTCDERCGAGPESPNDPDGGTKACTGDELVITCGRASSILNPYMARGTDAGSGRVIFNAVVTPPMPDPDNVVNPTSVPPRVAVAVLATVFLAKGETPVAPSSSSASAPDLLSGICSCTSPLPLMNLTLIAGIVSVNMDGHQLYHVSKQLLNFYY